MKLIFARLVFFIRLQVRVQLTVLIEFNSMSFSLKNIVFVIILLNNKTKNKLP